MAEDKKNKQLTAAEKAAAEKAEAERIEAEKADAEKAEAERIEAEKADAEKAEAERIEAEKKAKNDDTTYVMKVTHLSWGHRKMNHFYADKKPKISRKVMGNYHEQIDVWLKNKWIEEGKY